MYIIRNQQTTEVLSSPSVWPSSASMVCSQGLRGHSNRTDTAARFQQISLLLHHDGPQRPSRRIGCQSGTLQSRRGSSQSLLSQLCTPRCVPLQDEGEPLTEEAPTAKKPKLLQQALEEAQQEVATTTLVNTHPTNVVKKINWDLKRDIEPQLDRLERQTQLCIVDLLKERLAWEAQADDLD